MLGQEELISKLKSYSITNLPKSILFLGDKGCGKHTLAKDVAKHFNLELIDITENICLESIEEINLRPNHTIYLIDMMNINERNQNVLLKFIEEPSESTHIILLSTNKTNLLNTIVNRCIVFEFSQYSKSILTQFIDEKDLDKQDLILTVCTTPGQIKELNTKTINDLKVLCDKIVTKMKVAPFFNALSISSKINYKDEYDKYDLLVFFNMLINSLYTNWLATYSSLLYKMYQEVVTSKKKLRDNRINKQLVVENMLINLWRMSHNE